jgi:hypothetical protein
MGHTQPTQNNNSRLWVFVRATGPCFSTFLPAIAMAMAMVMRGFVHGYGT